MKKQGFGRWIAGLFVLALCLGLMGAAVSADVIWEPVEDDFYEAKREECTYQGYLYTVLEVPSGVKVYASPEDKEVLMTLNTGERIYVQYVYSAPSGRDWGMLMIGQAYKHECGWVPMDYLFREFDFVLFSEYYGEQISGEQPDLEFPLKAGDSFRVYPYPGSPDSHTISYVGGENFLPGMDQFYSDSYGHVWTAIGYYYGERDVWYCLDAPQATPEELYPDGLPNMDIRGASEEPSAENDSELAADSSAIAPGSASEAASQAAELPVIVPEEAPVNGGLIAALCGGAVGLAGLILLMIRRRKK